MLTHISSQNIRISFRSLFNVCTTAQQFVGTNVRISKETGSRKFKGVCSYIKYKGADKSLARPTSQCILFDGANISFDAGLVL